MTKDPTIDETMADAFDLSPEDLLAPTTGDIEIIAEEPEPEVIDHLKPSLRALVNYLRLLSPEELGAVLYELRGPDKV